MKYCIILCRCSIQSKKILINIQYWKNNKYFFVPFAFLKKYPDVVITNPDVNIKNIVAIPEPSLSWNEWPGSLSQPIIPTGDKEIKKNGRIMDYEKLNDIFKIIKRDKSWWSKKLCFISQMWV